MAIDIDTIRVHQGMEVFSSDGAGIGSVTQVWDDAGLVGTPPGDTVDQAAYGTTDALGGGAGSMAYNVDNALEPGIAPEPHAPAIPSDRRYFQVRHGGFLGIGASDLYIPFTAVCDCVPDQNVTVNCTKDECAQLYARKPDFLDQTTGTG